MSIVRSIKSCAALGLRVLRRALWLLGRPSSAQETVPHPVLPALPTISTDHLPLPLQVRHAPSPVERNGRRPIPPHNHKEEPC